MSDRDDDKQSTAAPPRGTTESEPPSSSPWERPSAPPSVPPAASEQLASRAGDGTMSDGDVVGTGRASSTVEATADLAAALSERRDEQAATGGGEGAQGHGRGNGHGGGNGHGHAQPEGATLVQLGIVGLLVGLLWLLHRFGGPSSEVDYDPTAMLALGFVVLASYTIGALVDVIKLPHITGYLLAGLFFGPSIAHLVGLGRAFAPFDEGVVHEEVIQQLMPLETLAIALIAISAGGELKLDALRSGLRPILGVLGGQLLAILVVVTGFIYLVSGPIEAITLPGLGPLPPDAVIPIGLTIAAVSFATSPSATLAVINETGARGPMSPQRAVSLSSSRSRSLVPSRSAWRSVSRSPSTSASSGAS